MALHNSFSENQSSKNKECMDENEDDKNYNAEDNINHV